MDKLLQPKIGSGNSKHSANSVVFNLAVVAAVRAAAGVVVATAVIVIVIVLGLILVVAALAVAMAAHVVAAVVVVVIVAIVSNHDEDTEGMMMSIFMSQATIIWSPIRTPKPSSPQIPGSNPSADRLPQALPVESGMSWNHNDFNCIRSICSIVPTRIYRSRSQIVRGSADDEEATGLWNEFLEYSVPSINYSMYGRYFKTIHLSKESLWTKFL